MPYRSGKFSVDRLMDFFWLRSVSRHRPEKIVKIVMPDPGTKKCRVIKDPRLGILKTVGPFCFRLRSGRIAPWNETRN
jgi:hypothetical protein